MKNLKNILALAVLSLAFYSVNAAATTSNTSEIATINTFAEDGPGDQGNEVADREDGEDQE